MAFLQWALPRLRLKWTGYRKVRKQVAKRIDRRMAELGLSSVSAYRAFLGEIPGASEHADEWALLYELCRIPISRFYRDRGVFDALRTEVLISLTELEEGQGRDSLSVWSAGCASGEEPYSLALIWNLELDGIHLDVLATDTDEHLLKRAEMACYGASSLKDLPEGWAEEAFEVGEAGPKGRPPHCLKQRFKEDVRFEVRDVRGPAPPGPFDLILCRYLAFTYFNDDLQKEVMSELVRSLTPGGALVVGANERPSIPPELQQWGNRPWVYRKRTGGQ